MREVAVLMSCGRHNRSEHPEETNYTNLSCELSALILADSFSREFLALAKQKAITLPRKPSYYSLLKTDSSDSF
jgi:hypothetical protein